MKSKIAKTIGLVFILMIACVDPAKVYGGRDSERACAIAQDKQSGYCLAGWTRSFGKDAPQHSNVLILYTDSKGVPQWARISTGLHDDEATSMVQTTDTCFVVTGWTNSYSKDLKSNVFILKINPNNQLNWAKVFLSDKNERAHSIIQTSDRGYAIVGLRDDRDSLQSRNVYMMKLDSKGNLEWANTYNISEEYEDEAFCLAEIPENRRGIRYVITGRARIIRQRYYDAFVLYLDSIGIPLRLFTVPGKNDDEAHSIIWDGSACVVAGWTNSYGPYVDKNRNSDIFVWKIALNGTFVLGKVYGWPKNDEKVLDDKSLIKSSGGGYVLAGWTKSVGPNVPQPNFLILKVDSTGQSEWGRVHPSQVLDPEATHKEEAFAIIERNGGGYAVAGWSDNQSFGLGRDDFHLLTLNARGDRRKCVLKIEPETASIEQDTLVKPKHYPINVKSKEMTLMSVKVNSADVCVVKPFGCGN